MIFVNNEDTPLIIVAKVLVVVERVLVVEEVNPSNEEVDTTPLTLVVITPVVVAKLIVLLLTMFVDVATPLTVEYIVFVAEENKFVVKFCNRL
jgi:hypothetical protein